MTECILSAPHRYDVDASAIANLFGDSAGAPCPNGLLAGFSFVSYLLLFGTLISVALWRRSPRWAGTIFAVSIACWSLVKISQLRLFDATAVGSQALFEIVMLALAPTALAVLVLRLRRKQHEVKDGAATL